MRWCTKTSASPNGSSKDLAMFAYDSVGFPPSPSARTAARGMGCCRAGPRRNCDVPVCSIGIAQWWLCTHQDCVFFFRHAGGGDSASFPVTAADGAAGGALLLGCRLSDQAKARRTLVPARGQVGASCTRLASFSETTGMSRRS
jgi:hypothetical protein